MPEEIIPGLFRLSIPLPNDSLGSVNVYAVVSADGLRLIDSGWNAPEAYSALLDELQGLGMQVSDIKEILVTHNHPDHIGLAERFVQQAGARLLHEPARCRIRESLCRGQAGDARGNADLAANQRHATGRA